jgi:cytochrome c oxidase subunit II
MVARINQRSQAFRKLSFIAAATMAAWGRAIAQGPQPTPSIFTPSSTPAQSILALSYFVLAITGGIFLTVGGILTYVIFRYRQRGKDDTVEPPQIYGSTQVEIAWTVIPVLIVVVLFLTTARMIFAIQDAVRPKTALGVTVIGHQYWWEFNYPELGIHAVNELHVPLSSKRYPKPTYLKLLSADVMHSFWVPQLAGKTDVIPNHENAMWIDPLEPGMYVGQCAQFCGVEHARMLLRVYVQTPEDFARWAKNQQLPAVQDESVATGRQIYETQACVNCHTIRGTRSTGRFGPDLTHLMSRETIAAGAAQNTPKNLRAWIENPDTFKEGALMPAMHLTDQQLDQITAYLSTLK